MGFITTWWARVRHLFLLLHMTHHIFCPESVPFGRHTTLHITFVDRYMNYSGCISSVCPCGVHVLIKCRLEVEHYQLLTAGWKQWDANCDWKRHIGNIQMMAGHCSVWTYYQQCQPRSGVSLCFWFLVLRLKVLFSLLKRLSVKWEIGRPRLLVHVKLRSLCAGQGN